MRRGWIMVLVLAVLLVAAYAVTSSPLFKKPADVSEGSELEYSLRYEEGKFVFDVKNPTSETKKLEFMTSEHFRILVKQDGNAVFDSSEGMMFTQQVNTVELEPGDTATYEAQWTDAEKGTYQVEAYLMAVSRDDPVLTMDLTID